MIRCPSCNHRNADEAWSCEQCGGELPEVSRPPAQPTSPALEREVRELVEAGKEIEAIKRFREETGAGLREAKDAVTAIAEGRDRAPSEISLDALLEEELAPLLERGNKIEAIKLYRQRTGAGLKEAKEAVEAIERGQPIPGLSAIEEEFEENLVDLLGRGEKLRAIMLYRERTGAGLREAKLAVEKLAASHGIEASEAIGWLLPTTALIMVAVGIVSAILLLAR